MEYLNSQFSILDKACKSRLNLQKLVKVVLEMGPWGFGGEDVGTWDVGT